MYLRTALLIALFTVGLSAAALSVDRATLAAGKPASLNVKLVCGTDAPTGVQFDLEYDATALDLTIEPGAIVAPAGKNLQKATIQPGKVRVLIIGFNKNVIPDGVLAILRVTYKGQESGKTFPLRLTATSGTNQKAEPVTVTGKDGSVTVEDGRKAQ